MENNIYKMMELKFLLNNEGKLITRWSDETKSSTESKLEVESGNLLISNQVKLKKIE